MSDARVKLASLPVKPKRVRKPVVRDMKFWKTQERNCRKAIGTPNEWGTEPTDHLLSNCVQAGATLEVDSKGVTHVVWQEPTDD